MYNVNLYNEAEYNASTLLIGLQDSMSSTDVISGLQFERLLFESQPLVDNMLRFFNQVDEMALDYFNPEDEATIEFNKGVVDAVATTDAPAVISFIKVLLENMSPADVATMVLTTTKSEAIVLSDTVAKAITDKVLPESMRLQDWISVRKTGNGWGD
jgi:hypothetical protein